MSRNEGRAPTFLKILLPRSSVSRGEGTMKQEIQDQINPITVEKHRRSGAEGQITLFPGRNNLSINSGTRSNRCTFAAGSRSSLVCSQPSFNSSVPKYQFRESFPNTLASPRLDVLNPTGYLLQVHAIVHTERHHHFEILSCSVDHPHRQLASPRTNFNSSNSEVQAI